MHRPGRKHGNTDALSRLRPTYETQCKPRTFDKPSKFPVVRGDEESDEEVSEGENEVISCEPIYAVEQKEKCEPICDRQRILEEQKLDKAVQNLKDQEEFYEDEDGLIYKLRDIQRDEYQDRVVVRQTMKNRIFKAYHDAPNAGHTGA